MIKVQDHIAVFPKKIMLLPWHTESIHIALGKKEPKITSPWATVSGTWHAAGNIPVWPPLVTDHTGNLRQRQELEQVGAITSHHEIWRSEEKRKRALSGFFTVQSLLMILQTARWASRPHQADTAQQVTFGLLTLKQQARRHPFCPSSDSSVQCCCFLNEINFQGEHGFNNLRPDNFSIASTSWQN